MRKRFLMIVAIIGVLALGSSLGAHEQEAKLVVAKRLTWMPLPAEQEPPSLLLEGWKAWASPQCQPETTRTCWVPHLCDAKDVMYCKRDVAVTQELRLDLVSTVPRRFQLLCVETSATITRDDYDCMECGEQPPQSSVLNC